jgi:glycine/D-amino acid oxidase-like deaminating enzyme
MKYFSPGFSRKQGLKPPDLYEYSIDNYWFKSAGIEHEKINEPLRGNHKADIVIIGGGYTGLSTAYNINRRFPNKHIMILEGAFCGYGASGRNGGFCSATALLDDNQRSDPDTRLKSLRVSNHGIRQIEELISEYGLDCDFEKNGMLEMAMNEEQTRILEKECLNLNEWGLDAVLLQGKPLENEVNSKRYVAGLFTPHGATLNPAKLARGMKRIVEKNGVEIREQSVVTRIVPGKVHHIDTELGEVKTPIIVLATNAYSHKLGFFQNHVFPMCTYVVATEPLSSSQWESIGWQNRQGISDCRMLFNYSIPSKDGRIIIGGSDFLYYPNDGLSSGNDKSVTRKIVADLTTTFPQLEGVRIEHAWGGSTAGSLGYTPSVGLLGDHNNIYYGVAYREGVPAAQTAGRIIADLMVKEVNEFTTHYIVNRSIPYAGPKYLRSVFGSMAKWYLVKMVRTWGH